MSVFRHHFLHHPGTHGHTREWKREITLSKSIKWEIKPEKLWKWEKDAVSTLYVFDFLFEDRLINVPYLTKKVHCVHNFFKILKPLLKTV